VRKRTVKRLKTSSLGNWEEPFLGFARTGARPGVVMAFLYHLAEGWLRMQGHRGKKDSGRGRGETDRM
jgi:hypothetical protein